MNTAIIPMKDDRKTGLRWLQYANGAFHCGVDLNSGATSEADFKCPIYAWADGEVVYAKNAGAGWGNIIVVYHVQFQRWSRYGHMEEIFVKVGDKVNTGTLIGTNGRGYKNEYSSHCHWEIIKKQLKEWDTYPKGWAKSKVLEYWCDPYAETEKINNEHGIPAWAIEACNTAQSLGLPIDFLEEMTVDTMQKDLKGLKAIVEVTKLPRYRWYEILRKLNLLKQQ